MNTPTPRTDAATYPADCLGTTLVTNRDCSRALETELGAVTGAYTCTHHNDQMRAACPVCLVATLTAERDQLRAELAEIHKSFAGNVHTENRELATERDQLRAKLHALNLICGTNDANKFETWVDRANARAERAEAAETVALANWNGALERAMKAEADLVALGQCHDDNCRAVVRLDAELAKERARLDHVLKTDWPFHDRKEIDAAMKEGAK